MAVSPYVAADSTMRSPAAVMFLLFTTADALCAPVVPKTSFESLLRADADIATAKRGEIERSLLQPGTELLALKQKRAVALSGGFGGAGPAAAKKGAVQAPAKKTAKTAVQAPAKRPLSVLAQELQTNGVVRIDGVLSKETAASLRDFVDAERVRADADVAAGRYDRASRFADLVLLENRCDLLLPLHGPCIAALHELLGEGSVLGPLLTEVIGDEGMLQEIACLISEPGAKQQPLHPDTPYTPIPPLYACFVALQDVSIEMGPTLFLPGTHTAEAHTAFYSGDLARGRDTSGLRAPPVPEEFLKSRPVKLSLLKAGDCALYNQQVLHCGSANESPDRVRRQFYISMRDVRTKVKARASIRPAFRNKLSLGEIRAELKALKGGLVRPKDENGLPGLFEQFDAIDSQPDDSKRDRHQAGSLYRSLEGGPIDIT